MLICIHILIQGMQFWGKSCGLPHTLDLASTMVQSLGCINLEFDVEIHWQEHIAVFQELTSDPFTGPSQT